MRNRRTKHLALTFMLSLIAAGCSGGGCSNGCSMEPLPEGGLPADQTVEGGAQVRITEQGFAKISALAEALFADSLGGTSYQGSTTIGGTTFLDGAGFVMCSGATDCPVTITFEQLDFTVPSDDTLRIHIELDVNAALEGTLYLLGINTATCTVTANLDNAAITADIGVGIDPGTGELDISVQNIGELLLNADDLSLCGLNFGGLVNGIVGLLNNNFLNPLVNALIGPLLDDMLASLLPDPLGIANTIDIGALIAGFAPSARGKLETRLVPGGYAMLENGGLSLGVITGFNADRDTTTRGPGEASQPSLCVPQRPAPVLGLEPFSLETITRNNGDQFVLAPSAAFRADSQLDLAMGISETALDLAGHHLIGSGALCLSISTEALPSFNIGTLGIIVPSLTELASDEATEPLMLVTRPQQPIDFTVGDGTESSPHLTLHLVNFEIDFYAFLFERWVRGFTVSLSADVGINLEFTTDADGNPALLPTLSGLSSDEIVLKVMNDEFVRETAAELEAVFPILLDLAVPSIAGSLGTFALPEFAGFSLDTLTIEKVTTAEDDFLAIFASLAASPAMMQAAKVLGDDLPALATAIESLAADLPEKTTTHARLREVVVPSPKMLRAAIYGDGGGLPEITIDVAGTDVLGRQLEWTWNLNGGMWRPFTQASPLVIRDGALAMQGKYKVGVMSRVVGDYRTTAEPVFVPVIIDSVPPVIDSVIADGHSLTVVAHDLVSDSLQYALSESGPWQDGALESGTLGAVAVYARDEAGNVSSKTLTPVAAAGGCSAGGNAGSTAVLALLGLGLFWGRRRRTRIMSLAGMAGMARMARMAGMASMAALTIALVACGGSSAGFECSMAEDCAAECGPGTIPLCTELGMCLCPSDVKRGEIGRHSSNALAADGSMWIAGYNRTHGDLMVVNWADTGRVPTENWEYLDGVPDGPIAVEGSQIRGGITAPGDDVGTYTSTVVTGDGRVLISYFDATNASLKLANRDPADGSWTTHIVDQGSPSLEGNAMQVGRYTAIALDSNDRPHIVYMAERIDSDITTTEVRLAVAANASPSGASDWTTKDVLDTQTAPTPAPGENTTGLPVGVGLFADVAISSTDDLAAVYYDRIQGALTLVTITGGTINAPEILDGGENGDAGWYPSVTWTDDGTIHVSYVDTVYNDLMYVNTAELLPELIDDGYRLDGQTEDGFTKPGFHFVGDDSHIVVAGQQLAIAYQDATTHELLLATRDPQGLWHRTTVAGNEAPYAGGYGFYAAASVDGGDVLMSTFVVDQPNFDSWVEIFRIAVESIIQ